MPAAVEESALLELLPNNDLTEYTLHKDYTQLLEGLEIKISKSSEFLALVQNFLARNDLETTILRWMRLLSLRCSCVCLSQSGKVPSGAVRNSGLVSANESQKECNSRTLNYPQPLLNVLISSTLD
jgi:hypothetical protein